MLLLTSAFALLSIASIAHASYQKGVSAFQEGDRQRAIELWEKAGDTPSNFALGMMLLDGSGGIPSDVPKAVRLFKKAANDGHAEAQNNLGIMYENGEGVEQNYQIAYQWYTKAAQQGEAVAINNLAALYAKGLGVERDIPKALEMFIFSSQKGYAVAGKNLSLLVESLPDSWISVDKANIRQQPDIQSTRLMTLERNVPVKLANSVKDWYQVIVDREGQLAMGWVSASLTAPKPVKEAETQPVASAKDNSGSPISSTASGQWGVQLGIFGSAANVRKLQQRLEQNGVGHFTEQFNSQLQTVIAGPYSSQQESRKAREKLQQLLNIEGIIRSLD